MHSGTTAEVARALLEHLSHSAALIDEALVHTATAAVAAGGRRRRPPRAPA
ncbi:hypothetical protein GCM10010234_50950 [Streptomyces hawaiiensis]|uniref:hypothetical protein n=1 Tax=Streptomyces hawaiiensis TaxID=67305 RepID=UPI0031CF64BD